MTIWKDVPGVLNADPKFIEKPVLLPEISYQEAIELAYFGAQVIHPKTIKPLQNKNIPLYVKSYLFPDNEGTLIRINKLTENKTPSIIFKKNQLLISISPRDFSFVIDQSLGDIFSILNLQKIKVNLIQNSAISISICLDYNERKLPGLLKSLQRNYEVYYNKGVELITIRHYKDETIREILYNLKVLIEQKTRLQFITWLKGIERGEGRLIYFLSKKIFLDVALSGTPKAIFTSFPNKFNSRTAIPIVYIILLSTL